VAQDLDALGKGEGAECGLVFVQGFGGRGGRDINSVVSLYVGGSTVANLVDGSLLVHGQLARRVKRLLLKEEAHLVAAREKVLIARVLQ